ncbi:short-chain dehydrogenase/reductase SDR [Richelia sinica FACHB-800]|uniref:Short-chain dehydrogenase/reductase SDR n=1 Tax=Richelia sinica FACHB-800 TaxID=1357546 RepID=A0A975Y4F7_9NOST|nr:SDR family oxidoreductase [Richelia sinica]MBD2666135.1 SDR family oxidoreductase [Richelia sinica FACHB-800]QXE23129.1 short-chain dehydrogenase/reductase SDR [Richelia sinica FACHB-800]
MTKVALITGVAGGIGKATAELFQAKGWCTIGVDRELDLKLDSISHYICADISDDQAVAQIVEEVHQKEGQLDTLINNAAISICKPVLETEIGEWDSIMSINLRSAFLLSQSAYPLLRKTQGSMVNVSSVHAIVTSVNIAAYAASKGGLVAFTRALPIEWAKDKIRVNAILPGAVDTAMLDAGLMRGHLSGANLNQLKQNLAQKTVIGKIGKPQEIAQAILFLADNNQSSFMTGQSIVVDG